MRCDHKAQPDQRLFETLRDSGDAAVREELVRRYLRLARHIAHRYAGRGVDADDLMQIATVALLNAVDRFDPSRGAAFSSFAVPTIAGELKRYFRDKAWLVRPPRDLSELRLRVERTIDILTAELVRTPTLAEVAARLGTTVEFVLEARAAGEGFHAVPLDLLVDDEAALAGRLGPADPGFQTVDDAGVVASLIATLPERAQQVLRLRFIDDLTQAEIGARLGLSQMHISRIERDSLRRLQSAATEDNIAAA
jgi:RNA polymerase sigma-B factor